jgi:hypothetical protein
MGRYFPVPKPKPPAPPGKQLIYWVEDEAAWSAAKDSAVIDSSTLIIRKDTGTFWRTDNNDPPHAFTPFGSASAGYTVVDGRSDFGRISAWQRVEVGKGDPLTLRISDTLVVGDTFQIVDVDRSFDKGSVTLQTGKLGFYIFGENGQRVALGDSLVLDTVGEDVVWSFLVTNSGIVVMTSPAL